MRRSSSSLAAPSDPHRNHLIKGAVTTSRKGYQQKGNRQHPEQDEYARALVLRKDKDVARRFSADFPKLAAIEIIRHYYHSPTQATTRQDTHCQYIITP